MRFGTQEILIVLGVVILLFGGKKIPELMRGVGKGMGEFKKGIAEGKRDDEDTTESSEKDKEGKAL